MDTHNNLQDLQEKQDEQIIHDAFQHLLDCYLASKHRKKVELITKAFNFAKEAHKGVRRLSGEPYIMHPIAVAQIVCSEIGLGSTSICSALLHDVVEDTDYTVEDIQNIFGPKIAQIVDGLTKISGGIFGEHASAQAENFKKLLLTMSDDVRVILIKIADRLHNMRTLSSQRLDKQYKIAGETLYIYAPLANRLGLNKIKTELEDLSFRYEHPEEYKALELKLQETNTERFSIFENFTTPIRQQLDQLGFQYHILARVKTPYSIWHKMQTKHVTFEEIYDILAIRIIFTPKSAAEELSDCFNIYLAISKIYKPHPDRIRDWISHPKANGYQALHVTLMSRTGRWIEVQIRSERMNDIDEHGLAAHWKYKDGGGSEDEDELNKWLSTVKEILDDPQPDAIDFLDTIKLNLFASEIFVFTPKGEIKTMPANCTVLDFAFTIHSFLGSHCIGAKVNHRLMPISHRLKSGDQVEILTSKSQRVQEDWVNFVHTAKAKTKIQAILRKEYREMQRKGEAICNAFFAEEELEPNSVNLNKLCDLHSLSSREELYRLIGQKKIVLGEEDRDTLLERTAKKSRRNIPLGGLLGSLFRVRKKKPSKEVSPKDLLETVNIKDLNRKVPMKLTEDLMGKKYKLADCCRPIPGDDVLGYVDEDNHIIIHKRSCPVAAKLKTSFGNRILATEWCMHRMLLFPAGIQLSGTDSVGVLNKITQVVSQQLNVNIRRINIEVNQGLFEGKIFMMVHDVDDVNTIISDLRKIEHITAVSRIG